MNQKMLHDHWQDLIGTFKQVDWTKKITYAMYVAQIYHYVKYTTRLISYCASRYSLQDEKIHQRFLQHLKEENHHDKLALNDLKNLGYTIDQLPAFAETKAFYLTQFALAELRGPECFTGYALLLEGMAVYYAKELCDIASKHFGPNTATFLRVHANEDEDHLPEAIKLFESAELKQKELIYESFLISKDLKTTWTQKCSHFELINSDNKVA